MMSDSGIPMGIVTPSFVDQTHQSHNSMHKIPKIQHENKDNDIEYGDPGQGYVPEDDIEDKPSGRGRSGTTVVHDEDPSDNRMSVQNVMDTLEEEENVPGNDTGSVRLNDVEEHSHDDMDDEEPPKHIKKPSIAEMIEQDEEIMNLNA